MEENEFNFEDIFNDIVPNAYNEFGLKREMRFISERIIVEYDPTDCLSVREIMHPMDPFRSNEPFFVHKLVDKSKSEYVTCIDFHDHITYFPYAKNTGDVCLARYISNFNDINFTKISGQNLCSLPGETIYGLRVGRLDKGMVAVNHRTGSSINSTVTIMDLVKPARNIAFYDSPIPVNTIDWIWHSPFHLAIGDDKALRIADVRCPKSMNTVFFNRGVKKTALCSTRPTEVTVWDGEQLLLFDIRRPEVPCNIHNLDLSPGETVLDMKFNPYITRELFVHTSRHRVIGVQVNPANLVSGRTLSDRTYGKWQIITFKHIDRGCTSTRQSEKRKETMPYEEAEVPLYDYYEQYEFAKRDSLVPIPNVWRPPDEIDKSVFKKVRKMSEVDFEGYLVKAVERVAAEHSYQITTAPKIYQAEGVESFDFVFPGVNGIMCFDREKFTYKIVTSPRHYEGSVNPYAGSDSVYFYRGLQVQEMIPAQTLTMMCNRLEAGWNAYQVSERSLRKLAFKITERNNSVWAKWLRNSVVMQYGGREFFKIGKKGYEWKDYVPSIKGPLPEIQLPPYEPPKDDIAAAEICQMIAPFFRLFLPDPRPDLQSDSESDSEPLKEEQDKRPVCTPDVFPNLSQNMRILCKCHAKIRYYQKKEKERKYMYASVGRTFMISATKRIREKFWKLGWQSLTKTQILAHRSRVEAKFAKRDILEDLKKFQRFKPREFQKRVLPPKLITDSSSVFMKPEYIKEREAKEKELKEKASQPITAPIGMSVASGKGKEEGPKAKPAPSNALLADASNEEDPERARFMIRAAIQMADNASSDEENPKPLMKDGDDFEYETAEDAYFGIKKKRMYVVYQPATMPLGLKRYKPDRLGENTFVRRLEHLMYWGRRRHERNILYGRYEENDKRQSSVKERSTLDLKLALHKHKKVAWQTFYDKYFFFSDKCSYNQILRKAIQMFNSLCYDGLRHQITVRGCYERVMYGVHPRYQCSITEAYELRRNCTILEPSITRYNQFVNFLQEQLPYQIDHTVYTEEYPKARIQREHSVSTKKLTAKYDEDAKFMFPMGRLRFCEYEIPPHVMAAVEEKRKEVQPKRMRSTTLDDFYLRPNVENNSSLRRTKSAPDIFASTRDIDDVVYSEGIRQFMARQFLKENKRSKIVTEMEMPNSECDENVVYSTAPLIEFLRLNKMDSPQFIAWDSPLIADTDRNTGEKFMRRVVPYPEPQPPRQLAGVDTLFDFIPMEVRISAQRNVNIAWIVNQPILQTFPGLQLLDKGRDHMFTLCQKVPVLQKKKKRAAGQKFLHNTSDARPPVFEEYSIDIPAYLIEILKPAFYGTFRLKKESRYTWHQLVDMRNRRELQQEILTKRIIRFRQPVIEETEHELRIEENLNVEEDDLKTTSEESGEEEIPVSEVIRIETIAEVDEEEIDDMFGFYKLFRISDDSDSDEEVPLKRKVGIYRGPKVTYSSIYTCHNPHTMTNIRKQAEEEEEADKLGKLLCEAFQDDVIEIRTYTGYCPPPSPTGNRPVIDYRRSTIGVLMDTVPHPKSITWGEVVEHPVVPEKPQEEEEPRPVEPIDPEFLRELYGKQFTRRISTLDNIQFWQPSRKYSDPTAVHRKGIPRRASLDFYKRDTPSSCPACIQEPWPTKELCIVCNPDTTIHRCTNIVNLNEPCSLCGSNIYKFSCMNYEKNAQFARKFSSTFFGMKLRPVDEKFRALIGVRKQPEEKQCLNWEQTALKPGDDAVSKFLDTCNDKSFRKSQYCHLTQMFHREFHSITWFMDDEKAEKVFVSEEFDVAFDRDADIDMMRDTMNTISQDGEMDMMTTYDQRTGMRIRRWISYAALATRMQKQSDKIRQRQRVADREARILSGEIVVPPDVLSDLQKKAKEKEAGALRALEVDAHKKAIEQRRKYRMWKNTPLPLIFDDPKKELPNFNVPKQEDWLESSGSEDELPPIPSRMLSHEIKGFIGTIRKHMSQKPKKFDGLRVTYGKLFEKRPLLKNDIVLVTKKKPMKRKPPPFRVQKIPMDERWMNNSLTVSFLPPAMQLKHHTDPQKWTVPFYSSQQLKLSDRQAKDRAFRPPTPPLTLAKEYKKMKFLEQRHYRKKRALREKAFQKAQKLRQVRFRKNKLKKKPRSATSATRRKRIPRFPSRPINERYIFSHGRLRNRTRKDAVTSDSDSYCPVAILSENKIKDMLGIKKFKVVPEVVAPEVTKQKVKIVSERFLIEPSRMRSMSETRRVGRSHRKSHLVTNRSCSAECSARRRKHLHKTAKKKGKKTRKCAKIPTYDSLHPEIVREPGVVEEKKKEEAAPVVTASKTLITIEEKLQQVYQTDSRITNGRTERPLHPRWLPTTHETDEDCRSASQFQFQHMRSRRFSKRRPLLEHAPTKSRVRNTIRKIKAIENRNIEMMYKEPIENKIADLYLKPWLSSETLKKRIEKTICKTRHMRGPRTGTHRLSWSQMMRKLSDYDVKVKQVRLTGPRRVNYEGNLADAEQLENIEIIVEQPINLRSCLKSGQGRRALRKNATTSDKKEPGLGNKLRLVKAPPSKQPPKVSKPTASLLKYRAGPGVEAKKEDARLSPLRLLKAVESSPSPDGSGSRAESKASDASVPPPKLPADQQWRAAMMSRRNIGSMFSPTPVSPAPSSATSSAPSSKPSSPFPEVKRRENIISPTSSSGSETPSDRSLPADQQWRAAMMARRNIGSSRPFSSPAPTPTPPPTDLRTEVATPSPIITPEPIRKTMAQARPLHKPPPPAPPVKTYEPPIAKPKATAPPPNPFPNRKPPLVISKMMPQERSELRRIKLVKPPAPPPPVEEAPKKKSFIDRFLLLSKKKTPAPTTVLPRIKKPESGQLVKIQEKPLTPHQPPTGTIVKFVDGKPVYDAPIYQRPRRTYEPAPPPPLSTSSDEEDVHNRPSTSQASSSQPRASVLKTTPQEIPSGKTVTFGPTYEYGPSPPTSSTAAPRRPPETPPNPLVFDPKTIEAIERNFEQKENTPPRRKKSTEARPSTSAASAPAPAPPPAPPAPPQKTSFFFGLSPFGKITPKSQQPPPPPPPPPQPAQPERRSRETQRGHRTRRQLKIGDPSPLQLSGNASLPRPAQPSPEKPPILELPKEVQNYKPPSQRKYYTRLGQEWKPPKPRRIVEDIPDDSEPVAAKPEEPEIKPPEKKRRRKKKAPPPEEPTLILDGMDHFKKLTVENLKIFERQYDLQFCKPIPEMDQLSLKAFPDRDVRLAPRESLKVYKSLKRKMIDEQKNDDGSYRKSMSIKTIMDPVLDDEIVWKTRQKKKKACKMETAGMKLKRMIKNRQEKIEAVSNSGNIVNVHRKVRKVQFFLANNRRMVSNPNPNSAFEPKSILKEPKPPVKWWYRIDRDGNKIYMRNFGPSAWQRKMDKMHSNYKAVIRPKKKKTPPTNLQKCAERINNFFREKFDFKKSKKKKEKVEKGVRPKDILVDDSMFVAHPPSRSLSSISISSNDSLTSLLEVLPTTDTPILTNATFDEVGEAAEVSAPRTSGVRKGKTLKRKRTLSQDPMVHYGITVGRSPSTSVAESISSVAQDGSQIVEFVGQEESTSSTIKRKLDPFVRPLSALFKAFSASAAEIGTEAGDRSRTMERNRMRRTAPTVPDFPTRHVSCSPTRRRGHRHTFATMSQGSSAEDILALMKAQPNALEKMERKTFPPLQLPDVIPPGKPMFPKRKILKRNLYKQFRKLKKESRKRQIQDYISYHYPEEYKTFRPLINFRMRRGCIDSFPRPVLDGSLFSSYDSNEIRVLASSRKNAEFRTMVILSKLNKTRERFERVNDFVRSLNPNETSAKFLAEKANEVIEQIAKRRPRKIRTKSKYRKTCFEYRVEVKVPEKFKKPEEKQWKPKRRVPLSKTRATNYDGDDDAGSVGALESDSESLIGTRKTKKVVMRKNQKKALLRHYFHYAIRTARRVARMSTGPNKPFAFYAFISQIRSRMRSFMNIRRQDQKKDRKKKSNLLENPRKRPSKSTHKSNRKSLSKQDTLRKPAMVRKALKYSAALQNRSKVSQAKFSVLRMNARLETFFDCVDEYIDVGTPIQLVYKSKNSVLPKKMFDRKTKIVDTDFYISPSLCNTDSDFSTDTPENAKLTKNRQFFDRFDLESTYRVKGLPGLIYLARLVQERVGDDVERNIPFEGPGMEGSKLVVYMTPIRRLMLTSMGIRMPDRLDNINMVKHENEKFDLWFGRLFRMICYGRGDCCKYVVEKLAEGQGPPQKKYEKMDVSYQAHIVHKLYKKMIYLNNGREARLAVRELINRGLDLEEENPYAKPFKMGEYDPLLYEESRPWSRKNWVEACDQFLAYSLEKDEVLVTCRASLWAMRMMFAGGYSQDIVDEIIPLKFPLRDKLLFIINLTPPDNIVENIVKMFHTVRGLDRLPFVGLGYHADPLRVLFEESVESGDSQLIAHIVRVGRCLDRRSGEPMMTDGGSDHLKNRDMAQMMTDIFTNHKEKLPKGAPTMDELFPYRYVRHLDGNDVTETTEELANIMECEVTRYMAILELTKGVAVTKGDLDHNPKFNKFPTRFFYEIICTGCKVNVAQGRNLGKLGRTLCVSTMPLIEQDKDKKRWPNAKTMSPKLTWENYIETLDPTENKMLMAKDIEEEKTDITVQVLPSRFGCFQCRFSLPRCVVCMCPYLNDHMDFALKDRNESFSQFSVCNICNHGGHVNHIARWFENEKYCAVAGCDCRCLRTKRTRRLKSRLRRHMLLSANMRAKSHLCNPECAIEADIDEGYLPDPDLSIVHID